DPLVAAPDYFPRLLQVEESQADAVEGAGDGHPHPVVDDEPALRSLYGRRAQADAGAVPPAGTDGYENLVIPPVSQVRRKGNPDVGFAPDDRTVDEDIAVLDQAGEEGSILVFRRQHGSLADKMAQVPGEGQGNHGPILGKRNIGH